MAELPEGEHSIFSWLDVVTLCLLLEVIPSFERGQVWTGIALIWLAFANHSIGVRWQISNYLIPPFLLTVLIYAGEWCFSMNTPMRYIVASVSGALILSLGVAAYSWIGMHSESPDKSKAEPPSLPDDKPPTLLDLFKTDFPSTLRASDTNVDAYTIGTPEGSTVKVKRQTYEDYEANTKFIGFYISRPDPPAKDFSGRDTFVACMELLNHNAVQDTFDHFGKQVAVMSGYGNQMTTSKELTFSGRVLIYHEEFLPIQSQAEIIKAYQAKELGIVFRGSRLSRN